MKSTQEVIRRFAECRDLCLTGKPHTPESLAEHRRLIAREYARAEERLSRQKVWVG